MFLTPQFLQCLNTIVALIVETCALLLRLLTGDYINHGFSTPGMFMIARDIC